VQAVALLRLNELSPAEARPYLLREVGSPYPRLPLAVLCGLPDQELPEFDDLMFRRVKDSLPYGDSSLAAGLLQRFASPAIAARVRNLLLTAGLAKVDEESKAHLFAYLLRAAPPTGQDLLRQELKLHSRADGRLLSRLADIRMSPEVEAVALEQLDTAANVQDALLALQRHASPQAKPVILSHYEQWHAAWISTPSGLELPQNRDLATVDLAYFYTLSGPMGWLPSDEELSAYQQLCVIRRCLEAAGGWIDWLRSSRFTIRYDAPYGDRTADRFSIAAYREVIGTLDRLKQKLSQYPKGTVFHLDTRGKDREAAVRIYRELKAWAQSSGFDVQTGGTETYLR
jgi:hypothetical protein